MTKDEALKLALAALEKLARLGNGDTYGNSIGNVIAQAAITAIKEALAQPKQCVCREPLRLNMVHRKESPCFDYIEHPWVGLTGDDMDDITLICIDKVDAMLVTEAKLKELNHV